MYSTHNFNILNPNSTQSPICGQPLSNPSPASISSKTVRIQKMFWDANDPECESPKLAELNKQFSLKKTMPSSICRLPTIECPSVHIISAYLGDDQPNPYCQLSVGMCDGLYAEIMMRDKKQPYSVLNTQTIESIPSRVLEHGVMAHQHNGTLQSFTLPSFRVIEPTCYSPSKKNYILVELELEGFNVATGLVGIGLPPITVFGSLVMNFLQRENSVQGDIRFAIGIHNIIYDNAQPHHSTSAPRKGRVQCYLVLDCTNEHQANLVLKKLSTNFKVSGSAVHAKRYTLTNSLPKTYWLNDMSNEVLLFCRENHGDPLDAAFHFAMHGRQSIPIATGFALFDAPCQTNHPSAPIHAWAETIYTSTEMVFDHFNEKYLYQRHYNDGVLMWQQE